ncbi:flagellar protein FliT [Lederbergia graminis]|uniref:Flagellar protein FliT n=1 Tax=Lederbergia graminis TaxID=735518 RepID=A0ABW0LR87_9BACI
MNAIEQCIQLTEEIIRTAEIVDEKDRDARIEKIDALLEEREQLFSLMEVPTSLRERNEGKRLLDLNKKMEKTLNNLQAHIQMDINQLSQKKKSAKRYGNPYAATESLDGMFYDKRK